MDRLAHQRKGSIRLGRIVLLYIYIYVYKNALRRWVDCSIKNKNYEWRGRATVLVSPQKKKKKKQKKQQILMRLGGGK